MPLPKAPSKLADILDDYGKAALPEGERQLPDVTNAIEMFSRAQVKVAPAAEVVKASLPKEAPSTTTPAATETPAPTKRRKRIGKTVAPKVPAITPETPTDRLLEVTPLSPVANAPVSDEAPKSNTMVAKKASKAKKTTTKSVKKVAPKATPTIKPDTQNFEAIEVGETTSRATTNTTTPTLSPTVLAKPHTTASSVHAFISELDDLRSRQGNAGRKGRVATPAGPRLYVLDTNVLMHDPLSLFRFAEHDIFLPMTTLEELDNHKKGLTDVARNARSVSRSLDALIEMNDGVITQGVPLSLLGNDEAKGRLWFETKPLREELPEELPSFKGDNSILATVRGVAKAFPKHAVVLVSKDINMRIKATTLGIPAEDYFSDKVLDDTDLLYSGKIMLEANFWETVAPTLKSWQDNGSTYYAFETNEPSKFILNACLWAEGDENFMATVTAVEGRRVTMRLMKDYRETSRVKVWGIHARNREQNMALNLLLDPEIDFVTILGQAGTGKTLMTLAAALTQTIDERRFSEIIWTRATVSVGEDIGYLPGTEEEKMAPWMGALEDNLEVLHSSQPGGEWGRQATMDLIRNRIRVKSMSFMRGRTFLQKFVIIDEAQNLSPKQMKTLITRAGPGTKIVCLGNISQIDTPYLTEGSSGLTYVVERFQGWAHAATITLTRGERSRLADFATEML